MAFDYKKSFAKPVVAPKKDSSGFSDPQSFLAKYGLKGAFDEKPSESKRPSAALFKQFEKAPPVDPPVPRELMEAMLFDDRDSLNSDEDWGAFHEHEAAMMQILNPSKYEADNFARAANKGGKKKKKGSVNRGRGSGFTNDRGGSSSGEHGIGRFGNYPGQVAQVANKGTSDYYN